jgi:hypothetical protein
MHLNNLPRRTAAALLLAATLATLCTSARVLAQELEVNEKLAFKAGESKLERQGEIEAGKTFVYLIHAEAGQRLSVAAVFRGNFAPTEKKPNAVFRDNTEPKQGKPNAVFRGNLVLDLRGPRPLEGGGEPPARVSGFTDGDMKWSGTLKESGDYLIILSRRAEDKDKASANEPLPYTLQVSLR